MVDNDGWMVDWRGYFDVAGRMKYFIASTSRETGSGIGPEAR